MTYKLIKNSITGKVDSVKLTDSSMTANDALRLYNINTNGGFQFSAEL